MTPHQAAVILEFNYFMRLFKMRRTLPGTYEAVLLAPQPSVPELLPRESAARRLREQAAQAAA